MAALPRDMAGDSVQMKLSFSPFAPFLLFVLEWMDCSCFDTFLSCLGLFHILVYKVSFHPFMIGSLIPNGYLILSLIRSTLMGCRLPAQKKGEPLSANSMVRMILSHKLQHHHPHVLMVDYQL